MSLIHTVLEIRQSKRSLSTPKSGECPWGQLADVPEAPASSKVSTRLLFGDLSYPAFRTRRDS